MAEALVPNKVIGLLESETQEIAAALRQTCAGCQSFLYGELPIQVQPLGAKKPQPIAVCLQWEHGIPADGTGYCHRFTPKETP